jgi:2-C-methyl-D-erythritol 4-phosphate cytidylyltransferase
LKAVISLKKKTAAIIVCAGSGKRMLDSCKDKLLLELSSKPVAVHSMEAFDRAASIDLLVVVTREELIPIYQQFKEEYGFQKELLVVCGGQTRMESVLNGVAAVSEDYSLIAIADGARPLIRTEDIERTIDAAKESETEE